jgi:hypothetical protein
MNARLAKNRLSRKVHGSRQSVTFAAAPANPPFGSAISIKSPFSRDTARLRDYAHGETIASLPALFLIFFTAKSPATQGGSC